MRLDQSKVIVAVLLGALLWSCPSVADNFMGIYADSLATSPCIAASGVVTCYVVMTDVADSVGISGWQFAVRIDSGGLVFAPVYPTGSINLQTFPRMMLGCAAPILRAGAMKLMSFTAMAAGPASIYIDHLSPDLPVLAVLASTGRLSGVDYKYGGFALPVFAMGGAPCPPENETLGVVPVVDSTWGEIKALFR